MELQSSGSLEACLCRGADFPEVSGHGVVGRGAGWEHGAQSFFVCHEAELTAEQGGVELRALGWGSGLLTCKLVFMQLVLFLWI